MWVWARSCIVCFDDAYLDQIFPNTTSLSISENKIMKIGFKIFVFQSGPYNTFWKIFFNQSIFSLTIKSHSTDTCVFLNSPDDIHIKFHFSFMMPTVERDKCYLSITTHYLVLKLISEGYVCLTSPSGLQYLEIQWEQMSLALFLIISTGFQWADDQPVIHVSRKAFLTLLQHPKYENFVRPLTPSLFSMSKASLWHSCFF